ncbi:MAG: glycosyltransferase family 39 protein, partial [Deltaproteobacteria bacterium]|nr:glycosyltransferase family 39 protein [Deltaproteobacteria bacterium]
FYGLGSELGSERGGRQGYWTGRLAAGLCAVYGPLIFFEGQMLAPGITVPLTAAAFWCLLSAGNRDRLWLLIVAGALTGLALMGRPNLLVVLPVGLIWLLLRSWSYPRKALAVGLAAAGLCLGLLPSWVHNASSGQEFVLVSSSGGHSFFIGNNSQATGGFHVPRGEKIDDSSHQAYRRSLTVLAERAQGQKLTPGEVSSYWYQRGFEFWGAHPGQALVLTGKKILLSVNGYERPIHHSYVFGEQLAPVLGWLVTFAVVFPFAILGILLGWRRYAGSGLLAVSGGAYLLTLVLFYVADRYRIMLLPMLLPLAGLGMVELAGRIKQVGKKAWPYLLTLAVAFAVTQLPMTSEQAEAKAMSIGYNLMGKAEGERGDLARAEKHFRRAIELAGPGRGAVVRTNLGLILERRGDFETAKELYYEAAAASSQWRVVRIRLARMSEREGDLTEALHWWQEVADLQAEPEKALAEVKRLQKMIKEKL